MAQLLASKYVSDSSNSPGHESRYYVGLYQTSIPWGPYYHNIIKHRYSRWPAISRRIQNGPRVLNDHVFTWC